MSYNETTWTQEALTKAGVAGQTTVGGATLYAVFGIGYNDSSSFDADTHHPLPFTSIAMGTAGSQDDVIFGTSTEPAATFTTADTDNTTRAASLVPMMWYVPDNITIDGVFSLEGGIEETTRTTRMHLYEYTFTSGSTSCLTDGKLLAHNLLAFFRVDSAASQDDFSVTVTVKYRVN
jgi:hypothetical protein